MTEATQVWLDDQLNAGDEQSLALVRVLSLIRSGRALTRPEISRVTGYGRTVVTQRVNQLLSAGLVREGELGTSTGGRAPRQLQFSADAGALLVAELGATTISVGIATLQGDLLATSRESARVADGPDVVLARVEELFDVLLREHLVAAGRIWGVGIGLPGPVEHATGQPISPPIMPG